MRAGNGVPVEASLLPSYTPTTTTTTAAGAGMQASPSSPITAGGDRNEQPDFADITMLDPSEPHPLAVPYNMTPSASGAPSSAVAAYPGWTVKEETTFGGGCTPREGLMAPQPLIRAWEDKGAATAVVCASPHQRRTSVASLVEDSSMDSGSSPDSSTDFVEAADARADRGLLHAVVPSRPLVTYEQLVWFFMVACTVFAVVDRFVWYLDPRSNYYVGSGKAAGDRVAIAEGPWSVAFYDIFSRISGRYLIVALNLQLFLYMNTFQRWIPETFLRSFVCFRNAQEARLRMHKWNGILMCVMTVVHVWSVLFPPIFHKWALEVKAGTFEYPLSERKPEGFKDIDSANEKIMLQVDDVFRIIEMTLLLCVLMPLSIWWMQQYYHVGKHLHGFIAILYFIDIVRRHTHPHSWIFNTPFFVLWLLDVAVQSYFRYRRVPYTCVPLSDDYIVIFWKDAGTERVHPSCAPEFLLKLPSTSLVEKAHVFTSFHNRHGASLCPG